MKPSKKEVDEMAENIAAVVWAFLKVGWALFILATLLKFSYLVWWVW